MSSNLDRFLLGAICLLGQASFIPSSPVSADEPLRVPAIELQRALPDQFGDFPVYLIDPFEIEGEDGASFEYFAGSEFTFHGIAGDRYRVRSGRESLLIDASKLLTAEEALKVFTERIGQSDSAENYAVRGLFHAERGNHLPALLDLAESLKREPNNVFTLWTRIKVNRRREEYEAVAADSTRILELFDADPSLETAASFERGDLFAVRAGARLALRQFEPALEDFDQALQRGANRFWVGQDKAEALNQLERYDDALQALEEVLKQDEPEFFRRRAKVLKARTLMLAKRYQEAIGLLDEIIDHPLTVEMIPEDSRELFELVGDVDADENLALRGRCYFKLGNIELSSRDLDAAIELSSWNATALCTRAELHLQRFEMKQALEDIRKASVSEEDDLEFQKVMLQIYVESGLPAQVIARCNDLMTLHRKDSELLVLRARAFLVQEKGPFALGDADRAVRASPDYARAYLMRGAARMLMEQRDAALEDLNHAVELDPNDYLNYVYRAHFWENADRQKCLDDLTKCIEVSPLFPTAYYTRALIYKNMLQHAAAANDLEKYLSFPAVLENRSKLRSLYHSLGSSHRYAGNYPKAIDALTRSLNERPPLFIAYRDRGDCFYEIGEYHKALDDYASFQKTVKGSPSTYLSKGKVYLALGQPETALKEIELCLERLPEFGAARHYRALSLLELDRIDEARAEVNYLLETHPESGLFRIGSSRLLVKENKPEEALAELTKGIELAPEQQEVYRERAALLTKMNRHDEAAKDFTRLFELNPWNADLLLKESKRHAANGDSAEADRLLGLYLTLKPDDRHVVLLNQALRAIDAGEIDEAFRLLGESLDHNPRYVSAYYQRGNLADKQHKYALAMADFEQLMLLQPENIEWEVRRGMCLLGLGRNQDAIEACTQVLAKRPKHSYAFNNRGVAYERLKQFQLALDDYTSSINSRPVALAFGNRGRVYFKVGEFRKGIDDLERAVALVPEHAEYLNQLAWAYATNPDDSIRDGKDAVEFAQRSCKASNYKVPGYIDTLAAAHAENGDFEQAIEFQQLALSLVKNEKLSAEFEMHLKLYQARKPYRESPRVQESQPEKL